MSEQSSPPPAESTLTQFSVQLVTHTKVPALTPAGKPTQKNKKDVKSKELSFACTEVNYIGFLRAILDKHNETKYTVSAQHHFPFKYYLSFTLSSMHITWSISVTILPMQFI